MSDLPAAVRELLAALGASRTPYVPTARNSPDPAAVRHSRQQRLKRAEQAVRDLLEQDTP